MRTTALLLALCLPACRTPGGWQFVPSVNYGTGINGTEGDYISGGVTILPPPPAPEPARPAPEVVEYRPFLDGESVDLPAGPDPAAPFCADCRAAVESWLEQQPAEPEAEPPAHQGNPEAVTFDTPIGPVTIVGSNLIILGLLWFLMRRGVIPSPRPKSKED